MAMPRRYAKGPSESKRTDASALKFGCVDGVGIAEEMNPRFRPTMEDTYVAVDAFTGDAKSGFFGVYDGHGGRDVAEYLRKYLHANVAKELKSAGKRTPEECIHAAYLDTDIACSKTGPVATAGSTAVTCYLRHSSGKRYVITANCGDARAVLCQNGEAVRLSKDHKATDKPEVERVVAAGGFMLRKRVMGVLAVARSFGDYVLKKFVPAEPYISRVKLDSMSQFLIIACDGIWDVLSDKEACDLVREVSGSGRGRKAKACAKALMELAITRGSTDNVTVLVVWL